MAEVLIRDVPEAVLADIDAHAARLGLSRSVGVWRLMRLVRARRCLWTTSAFLRRPVHRSGRRRDHG